MYIGTVLPSELREIRDVHTGRRIRQFTAEAGWAIWGEMDVRGVYDHLSAINPATREVWYFDGTGLFATHLETLDRRQVWELGGRICISQVTAVEW